MSASVGSVISYAALNLLAGALWLFRIFCSCFLSGLAVRSSSNFHLSSGHLQRLMVRRCNCFTSAQRGAVSGLGVLHAPELRKVPNKDQSRAATCCIPQSQEPLEHPVVDL